MPPEEYAHLFPDKDIFTQLSTKIGQTVNAGDFIERIEDNIEDDDVKELKLLCRKYIKARNDIPADVLEKLDSRRKDKI